MGGENFANGLHLKQHNIMYEQIQMDTERKK